MSRQRCKGRYICAWGYVIVRKHDGDEECPWGWKDGRIYEHVLKVWRAGWAYNPKTDVIHHINFDKTDNRLINLVVIKRTAHNTRTQTLIVPQRARSGVTRPKPKHKQKATKNQRSRNGILD